MERPIQIRNMEKLDHKNAYWFLVKVHSAFCMFYLDDETLGGSVEEVLHGGSLWECLVL